MHAFEDRAFSWLAIGLVVMLASRVMVPPVPPAPPAPSPREAIPGIVDLPMPSRVTLVAEAIATSEGYYAPGVYRGHSLAYVLNNPGLLKATPIAGDDLPTWRDTGLLVFDTSESGWTALRHQVCLMLTGASRQYDPRDSLHAVGLKYADGDGAWAVNVAKYLRVSPQTTLATLGGGLPADLTCLAS